MSLLDPGEHATRSRRAAARPTDAGTVGIGVGVAVNKVDITNLATTNNATINSVGLDVEATMRDTGIDPVQRFDERRVDDDRLGRGASPKRRPTATTSS